MKRQELSYQARKALMVHIGEKAGTEIANLIQQMADEIDQLRRTKVTVTKIVPGAAGNEAEQEWIEEPI